MRRALLVLATLLVLGIQPLAAAEKWADAALKTPDGLILWLDAQRQPAAWQAQRRAPLQQGVLLDAMYDASGNGMHLVQPVQTAQPRFIKTEKHAVLRFDGKDDYLFLMGQKRALNELTLFVVAAPRSNAGFFKGLVAFQQLGKNDYSSGLTLDLSGFPTTNFASINIEGEGFGGARNLLQTNFPFGTFHTLEVHGKRESIELIVDGKAEGQRPRKGEKLALEQLFVGARCYSNSAEPPFVQGFLDGDIAEVLLFERLLTDDESKTVRDYLKQKHAGLGQALAQREGGVALNRVTDPPPIQMLVPGFTVKQLPVDLPNINNVKYRADGKLLALGYNGDLYLLSDSDGDGLEDKVSLFWENKGKYQAPIGMALTPPGYERGTGAFLAVKGKVLLLVDTNKDDKADKEIVVAEGWTPLAHGVDALGVALDAEGNLFFGLGTADYTNAYLLDKEGKPRYDLKSERGTILKVSPDFKRREIVCTGIRFPVALAVNRHGDLFGTDQEGATWMPNGNPFDELLHIQTGRHYGFPPRHPKYLPGVIDEPSVFDYGPQHQSTCGINFNDPARDGKSFGPVWWQGDALVCGYSRGKLYRTKLVKTAAGYVAQNQLLACLNMLTVDACVAPAGALVIATHSGKPDWGVGPTGKGKLYKVFPVADTPQPVLAWMSGPRELRVTFDRPLEVEQLTRLGEQARIEYGRIVRPGDRFEALQPPYAVVQQELALPRHQLPVFSVQVTPDRRTLVLATGVQTEAVPHALTLPGLGRPGQSDKGTLAQHPTVDLAFDLHGVEVAWQAREGGKGWTGWLPHVDLAVSRELTRAGSEQEVLWEHLQQPGTLTLKTQLDLWQLLRPATQPGTTLEHPLPVETVMITLSADRPFEVNAGGAKVTAANDKNVQRKRIEWTVDRAGWVPLEIKTTTTDTPLSLRIVFSTKEDARERALPLRRFVLPWATREKTAALVKVRPVELEGGNWAQGRALFFSEQAQCAKCHQLRGQGGKIGPDLSNLVHRDYASVLRDIQTPSVSINPDHLSYLVELKNGKVAVGTLRSEGKNTLIVGDGAGQEVKFARDQIESLTVSPVSTMPEGIDRILGAEKMRDLMTFLLTEPLSPAPIEAPGEPPPPRSRAEVEAILKGSLTEPVKPLRILLATGPKDHGPGEHDYPLFQRRWFDLLSLAEKVTVHTITGWPTPAMFEKADVVIFYSNNPGWTAERGRELDAFLARGGGLLYLHYAVDGHKEVEALADRIGLAWKGGASKFRHGALELDFTASKHPIARNFGKVKFTDESYWQLTGDSKKIDLLATGVEEGKPQPLLWTREVGKGRIVVNILGHYNWTFDDPLFRILVLRSILWSARQPIDRLNDLAAIGARLKE